MPTNAADFFHEFAGDDFQGIARRLLSGVLLFAGVDALRDFTPCRVTFLTGFLEGDAATIPSAGIFSSPANRYFSLLDPFGMTWT